MPKPTIRRFGFKPYYYDKEKEERDEKHRIKFKRLLKSPRPERKPIRRWLLLVIAILYLIWYLNNVKRSEPIQVESLRIEDVSPH